jgi:G3E family GTPase
VVKRVEQRVRERNPHVTVVTAIGGEIDPQLLYDVPGTLEEPGQLSLRELLVDAATGSTVHDHDQHTSHADAVTAVSDGAIDPGALIDLLEDPPPGVYRLKGAVVMRYGKATPTFAINLVGSAIHIAQAPPGASPNCLVAIGVGLDADAVRAKLDAVLRPPAEPVTRANVERLRRYRRRSL